MRIVFFGTPEIAATVLNALADAKKDDVAVVVTQPDQPVGRGRKLMPPPVKQAALTLGFPILQPAKLKNNSVFLEQFRAFSPDLGVVVSYGKILPDPVLAVPTLGLLNIHFSLLPRYRGASPVRSAILDGVPETGVTIMKVVARLDAGPICARRAEKILPDDTTGSLEKRLTGSGVPLLLDTLDAVRSGVLKLEGQNENDATFTAPLDKADGLVDWRRTPEAVDRHVRAMNPWPGAFSFLYPADKPPLRLILWKTRPLSITTTAGPGTLLEAGPRIFSVACGRGAVELLSVQAPGKKAMSGADFVRGARVKPGDFFMSGA